MSEQRPSDYDYIGRLPCGCVVAAVIDNPNDTKFTSKAVAEFIADGLTIERVPNGYVQEHFLSSIEDCPHLARQLRLLP